MNIGIVGLGLIGGSIAKAIKLNTKHTVYGTDIVESTIYKAKLVEAIDDFLTEDKLKICDMIIVALYPKAIIKYVTEHAQSFKQGAIVMDCGGTKENVCADLKNAAEQNNFTFIGGHPMAGIESWGFTHSKDELFKNASMIITPYSGSPIELLDTVKSFCLSIGFSSVQITSPEEHDRIIALTSQLAHVVSSAYVKSPTALKQKGFSAGSFRDMTRVAKLNEDMWTELFMENRENLAMEIDGLIERLNEYSAAIKNGNEASLKALLKEGRERKEALEQ